jgi:hypothetical protein
MPVLGSGIFPSGAVGNELTAVTRRAFIPKLVVQLYKASPLLSAFIANAQMASGGAGPVTAPVQGSAMTTFQWSGYNGNFAQQSTQVGIQNAEFNLKLGITPVYFLGMEGIIQVDAAVIPIIEARMNDAGNTIKEGISLALWNNSNSANNQQLFGLPAVTENNVAYGNIDPLAAGNSFWNPYIKVYVTTAPTRNTVLENITGLVNNSGGEMPNFGVTSPATWVKLAEDFTSLEQYQVSQDGAYGDNPNGARALFTALMVAGVPIYMDTYGVDGTLYLLNTNYLSLYIHEAGSFVFTGFESLIPNQQLGYVGALLAILELVCVKRKAQAKVTGYTSVTF